MSKYIYQVFNQYKPLQNNNNNNETLRKLSEVTAT